MQPPPEDGTAVEAPPEPLESGSDPNSFDPGVETGYLRRAPREGPPQVELGAHPFDPGPGTGFDGRRAKRRRRRREREEQQRAEAEAQARSEAERAAESEAERVRIETERAEAEELAEREAEVARLEAAERDLEEAEERAVAAAERSRSAAEERVRAEKDARARAAAERAEARAAHARAEAERSAAAESPRRAPAAKASRREAPERRGPARRRPARPMPAPADPPPANAGGRGGPQRQPAPAPPGLAGPTAKLTAGLAAVIVGAALLGSALGLPTPFSGSDGRVAASLGGAGPQLGVGTAAALYRGPFHPVLGNYEYGESAGRFGASRGGRKHEGQDIFSKSGTPLVAVRDGVVVDRGTTNGAYSGGRGNYLAIYSPIENRSYVYLHLLKPALVDKGERVHAGQMVGQMGCTGSCDGTHLHFEVRIGRASFAAETKAIDPLPFVKGLPQAPAELTKAG